MCLPKVVVRLDDLNIDFINDNIQERIFLMKLSDSKEIFELAKSMGIQKDLSTLTKQELEELSKDSDLKNQFPTLLNSVNRNLYQELSRDHRL